MRALVPIIAATLLLGGCGDAKPDPRGVDHDETVLSVSAMGEAESVPDEAGIQIGIESFAANAQSASAAMSRKGEAIAAALAKYGVAAKDIQTSNLSIARVEYGSKKGQFQASNILSVRLHDVAKAGEAVAAATDAGANVLSGPSLRISDPEKANRGAYIAAYQAARTRADAYAEAAGLKISRVLAIRDGGESGGMPQPYAYEAADAMARTAAPQAIAEAPPPSIRPGTSRVRVSVQVDFALVEK